MRKIDPVKQEAKRRQIMDAALACFARKGLHATSTNDICAEVGMSPGNLFHYFPSKLALITTIAEAHRDQMAEHFADMAQQDDVLAAIEGFALELMKLSMDPVDARFSIELMAEAMGDSDIAKIYLESDRRIKHDLIALLERGIAKGQIDPEIQPDVAATWLIALADGTVSRAQLDPDFSVDTHAPVLVRLIHRFLAAAQARTHTFRAAAV